MVHFWIMYIIVLDYKHYSINVHITLMLHLLNVEFILITLFTAA